MERKEGEREREGEGEENSMKQMCAPLYAVNGILKFVIKIKYILAYDIYKRTT